MPGNRVLHVTALRQCHIGQFAVVAERPPSGQALQGHDSDDHPVTIVDKPDKAAEER